MIDGVAAMQAFQKIQKSDANLRGSKFYLFLISILFLLFISLPLLVWMVLGTFTRYLADDYSTSGILLQMGFWKAQAYWYYSWSGRYSFTFLVSLVELAGVAIVPWLPVFGLLAWMGSLYWTMLKVWMILKIEVGKIWTFVLVNTIIFGTIKSFQEYAQVLFWQTGILTYLVSIIFVTIVSGVLLERFYFSKARKLRIIEVIVWLIIFFFAGGFSETWVIVQIALLGMGIIFFLAAREPSHQAVIKVFTSGFMGSCLALLVIARAPGNISRNPVTIHLSFDLLRNAIFSGLADSIVYVSEWFSGNTVIAVMLVLAGLTLGLLSSSTYKNNQSYIREGIFAFLCAYVSLWAGFALYFAVMGVRPVERAIFCPMYLFIWALVFLAIIAGVELRKRLSGGQFWVMKAISLALWAILLILVPVRASYSLIELVPSLQLYARLWEARDAKLRLASASGEKQVIVESFRRNLLLHDIQKTFWIDGDLQDSSNNWINQAAANFYGLTSIALHK
jgi:hypothetical protein